MESGIWCLAFSVNVLAWVWEVVLGVGLVLEFQLLVVGLHQDPGFRVQGLCPRS